MHDPYEFLATNYDIMIDWPARIARERPFFEDLFRQTTVGKVLDIGSGTGYHCRLFAELGATVIGLDMSVSMLQRARALTPGDNPFFIEGGFQHIHRLKRPIDLITVLGNTLAHVQDLADLQQALQAMHDTLSPNGLLCVQVINYDKLLTTGSHCLPILHRQVDGRDYLFLREHRLLHDHVEFTVITLQHDTDWQQQLERSIQLPLPRAVLDTALQQAGYTRIRYYSDYDCTPFEPDTANALIAIAS